MSCQAITKLKSEVGHKIRVRYAVLPTSNAKSSVLADISARYLMSKKIIERSRSATFSKPMSCQLIDEYETRMRSDVLQT